MLLIGMNVPDWVESPRVLLNCPLLCVAMGAVSQ